MSRLLGLVRHGRAAGQGPEAPLLSEGAAYVTNLGRKLAREGWAPALAFSSPYLRARDTARILLGELASSLSPRPLPELTPDFDPRRTLETLRELLPPSGQVLVVAHMPLLGRLVVDLTGDSVEFWPGTFAEIALEADAWTGELVRRIGPDEL